MSDNEVKQMFQMLRRYAETELDQWEYWRFDGPFSKIYIHISMQPDPGASDEAYTDVSHLTR